MVATIAALRHCSATTLMPRSLPRHPPHGTNAVQVVRIAAPECQESLCFGEKRRVFLGKQAFPARLRNFLNSGGGALCLFAPGALGKFAGFLGTAQQAVGTDVAIELRPIN